MFKDFGVETGSKYFMLKIFMQAINLVQKISLDTVLSKCLLLINHPYLYILINFKNHLDLKSIDFNFVLTSVT